MSEPPDLLMDVLTEGGTYSATCGFCGTLWYTRHDIDREDHEKNEKALQSTNDSLAIGHLDGKQLVYGCCHEKLRRYADWIWNNRDMIARYIKKRAKEQEEEAKATIASIE